MSVTAAPGRKTLFAAIRRGQRVNRIRAHLRGFIARQHFQFIAHLERIALDKGNAVLDLDRDLAALFAANRRGREHLDRTGGGRHMDPGTRGQQWQAEQEQSANMAHVWHL